VFPWQPSLISNIHKIEIMPTNKANRHDITEILLKVALNTITLIPYIIMMVVNPTTIRSPLIYVINITEIKIKLIIPEKIEECVPRTWMPPTSS
jgi:hypothetical protein